MTTDLKRAPAIDHKTSHQLDRHTVYQQAVQSPEADAELVQYFYRLNRNKTAYHFREDFCGTAITLANWIQQGPEFSGEGFDIDSDTIKWGQRHNFDPLGENGKRGLLHRADARAPSTKSPDVRCAFNFSYWIFTQRKQMLEYFQSAYQDLAKDGVFVLDFHGGAESLAEEEAITDCGEFLSIWHQTGFSPVTHTADLALHFRFPDGSAMENAFRYHWRIWSIPEITDLLSEAGFASTNTYWYDGEGEYELTRVGQNDPTWIACLAALK
ncbi:MAG: hypothetical protein GKR96_04810 [Gammaproteobacteria bacterium]|nr:hypothetical protein [Gammaproteobacteria bacterium]